MRKLFIVSLIVNLLFVSLGGYWVYKRIHAKANVDMRYDIKTSMYSSLPANSSAIVMLGDSLTALCEWHEILQNPNVENRGISGDTTTGVLKRLDQITATHPRKIFLMIGINDLVRKVSESEILANHTKIITTIRQQSPETKIYVLSILPVNTAIFKNIPDNQCILSLNNKLHVLAENTGAEYVDLYSDMTNDKYIADGLHLNGNGYQAWAGKIKPLIEQ